jgi:hypothetical protein
MPGIGAEQCWTAQGLIQLLSPENRKLKVMFAVFGGLGLFVFKSLNSHQFPKSFVYRITNTKKVQTRSLIRARLEGLLKE